MVRLFYVEQREIVRQSHAGQAGNRYYAGMAGGEDGRLRMEDGKDIQAGVHPPSSILHPHRPQPITAARPISRPDPAGPPRPPTAPRRPHTTRRTPAPDAAPVPDRRRCKAPPARPYDPAPASTSRRPRTRTRRDARLGQGGASARTSPRALTDCQIVVPSHTRLRLAGSGPARLRSPRLAVDADLVTVAALSTADDPDSKPSAVRIEHPRDGGTR